MFLSRQKDMLKAPFFSELLDAQDTEMIVADDACRILLTNGAARKRGEDGSAPESCRAMFSGAFPGLCDNCPVSCAEKAEDAAADIRGKDECRYTVRYRRLKWHDGKPATVMFIRNVDEERAALDRLYSLAYIDQLTGIANRRRLKEDFEAVAESVFKHETAGALAIFDLDNFKTVNDSYGHKTGDTMLKCLTEHLQSEPDFRDHLYRLGGDEFVLLYTDSFGKFPSMRECRQHYLEIMGGTLRAYTLPDVGTACTLSLGAAFFPWQGDQFSDLLRKADIALYKAKENGRNQIAVFDEKDDIVKTFRDLFISIQPVLTAEGRTCAYMMEDQNKGKETAGNVLNLRHFDRTIEALGIEELENKVVYFISYSDQLLSHLVAKNLPKNKFVIRIALREECGERELEKYRDLRSLGYTLAFTGVNAKNAPPELLSLAAYCVFDPREADERFLRGTIMRNRAVGFIATGVDSRSAYEEARRFGFSLFAGFYFKEVVRVKKTKEIDPLKLNYFRLLKLTSTDDFVDFQEISSIISSDVALSYRLLRLLNSAAVAPRNPIASISMAVAYLGEVNLKKWIALLALRGLAAEQPMELIRTSLVRAQLGENLSALIKSGREAKGVFLTGLLSLLDVALEKSKEEVLREIRVAAEIRDSLLTDEGPYSDLVRFFSAYENGEWDDVTAFAVRYRLTDKQINGAYFAALKWYNALSGEK